MSASGRDILHSSSAGMLTGVSKRVPSVFTERLQAIRFRFCRKLLLTAFSLPVAAIFPFPQQPSPQGVIRITVNLVQVDAVVTDKKGHQVTNLRPQDFEILEDGRPQTITNFSYVSIGTPGKTVVQAAKLAHGMASLPPARLRREQVRRTIAIDVDDLHISFENMPYVRQALRKFVDEDVQPGDLVAILHTSRSLGVLQEFTNNKRVLEAAIEHLHYYLQGGWGLPGGSIAMPRSAMSPAKSALRQEIGKESAVKSFEVAMENEREFGRAATSVGTIDTLDYVIRGLRNLPGRKAVVLMSETIPLCDRIPCKPDLMWERLQKLADLADRSSTVIYAIDALGLPTLQLNAANSISGLPPIWAGPASNPASPSRVSNMLVNRQGEYRASQEPMGYLANRTGGIFVHDINDLAMGMREVINDMSGYYLIGYKPPANTFKSGETGPDFHHIKVRVKVRGLHVRSRSGFYGVPEMKNPVHLTPEEQLRAAVTSAFGASGIHVQLASQFVNEGREDNFARLWLHVDAHNLTLQGAPGGTKKGTIDILGVAFGNNGVPVADLDRTFRFSVKTSELAMLRKWGLNYRMNVPVKEPGGYQTRVAVLDSESRRIGSASEFIEVPDLRRHKLTLSGIVLDAGALGDKSPAVRRYRAGERVSYELEIYNARMGKSGRSPDLEGSVGVFHDGRLMATAKPGLISRVPKDPERLAMMGEFTLVCEMPPGEYVLQVTITDRRKHKRKRLVSAVRWVDFQILPSSGE